MNWTKSLVLLAVFAAGAAGAYAFLPREAASPPVAAPVSGQSEAALTGKAAYDKNCSECHGQDALGSDKGPPLIHRIYNPGHHSDLSFFLAVKNGVRSHHWKFGDMPPQPEVAEKDVAAILGYIRESQRAAGISTEPH